MDITKLPKLWYEQRAKIITSHIDERVQKSVDYIHNQYENQDLLSDCDTFNRINLFDAPKGEFQSLVKIGFFPWTEASREYSEALNQAILTNYKSAIDHIRRGLELIVVGLLFSTEECSPDEVTAWLESDKNTPLFSRALGRLQKHDSFLRYDTARDFVRTIKEFYWLLCDYVHVKGKDFSFNAIQPSHFVIGGIYTPTFEADSLKKVLDLYIQATRFSCTMFAVMNPILLVGLPLDMKFGLNPPISGFFHEGQSEMLNGLILDVAKDYFTELLKTDEEVKGILEWFESLPDLTDEDFERQAKATDELISSMSKKEN